MKSIRDRFNELDILKNEDAVTSLDFYQGVLEALSESKDSVKIELSIYDNWNSDSVTAEILKNPELKKVMLNVRKQVLRYEKAKKAGTLKKTDQVATRLF